MKSKQDEIEELQQKIYKLEAEKLAESRAKYLPEFLEKSKIYYGLGRCKVEMPDEFYKRLINDCCEEKGYYHFKIDFDEELVCYFDDGEIYLSFQIPGNTVNLPGKMLEKCKKYGIKLDFSLAKKERISSLCRAQQEVDKLNEIEKMFEI